MTTDAIQNQFSRAQIAEALEISGNQILQYQERGLLAERSAHAQDIAYNSLDIARLRFILRCEAAGYQGNDIVDFMGTVNKGANIKEQLKASLVHAHQKFSYVNAQKRKADILEQVNLQADADLIQKYIDEMKGILDDPLKPPINIAVAKRSSQPSYQPERPSRFQPESQQATKIKPIERREVKPEPEPDRSSRLKAGLERSQRSSVEPKQTQRPQRRANFQKDRNKFIDSSIAGTGYDQRGSFSPSDAYTHYSGTKSPKSSSAWKQTLITFLLLSVLSIAGYMYYAMKDQQSSLDNLAETIQDSITTEENLTPDGENDKSSSMDNFLDEKKKKSDLQKELETENIKPVNNSATEVKEETPATVADNSQNQKYTPPESNSPQPDSQNSEGIGNNATQVVEPPSTIKPVENSTTEEPSTPDVYNAENKDIDLVPTPTSPKTESTGNSLSDTAMKDLDDLLSEKQRNRQSPTPSATESEVYAIAERPQVAVYDFKIFYQRSRKILIAKFKIARIRPQRNLIQGKLFVLFKPRQSARNTDFFSVPDVRIVDGIPAEPFKGIEFSFSESTKVQSVRTIYVRDPSQFDIATIFVFSNAGELVLRKDFTVDITEY